jgi:hypothetical protein
MRFGWAMLTLWVNLDQGLVVAHPQQYESLCYSNERLAVAFRLKRTGFSEGATVYRCARCRPKHQLIASPRIGWRLKESLLLVALDEQGNPAHGASRRSSSKFGRGRDSGCPLPPAQTRAGAASAHGSYLGCLASKRTWLPAHGPAHLACFSRLGVRPRFCWSMFVG